jgi:S1-C subfamily serine protease
LLLGVIVSIAGASSAEVARGWLGFGFTYPKGAEGEREAGLVVQAVLAEGPAAKAGLERGDVILLIDGVPVSRHGEAAVLDFVLSVEPGQEVALGILREEERRTLQLVAMELPPQYLDGWRRLAEARDRLRAAEGGGGT